MGREATGGARLSRAAREQQIMEGAAALAVEQGCLPLPLETLGQRVGVSKALVYAYFPTQQDLANMVGSCRETISRTFNALARKGLIVPRGRALIVTKRLVQMSEPARAA